MSKLPTDMANETLVLELRAKISELERAEEGAKKAFAHVVQQKRDLEAKCKQLQSLLDDAYASIKRYANASVA